MLPATGSTMTAAISLAVALEQRLDAGDVVEAGDQRLLRVGRGHARAVGQAERRDAGAGLDEQAVGVAVVAALELDDLVAAGEGAGQAQRATSSPRCRS